MFQLTDLKGAFMQTEKALINDHSRVSKVFWKFFIPTVYNFAEIHPGNLLFSWKVGHFSAVSTVFSVYEQNLTAQ